LKTAVLPIDRIAVFFVVLNYLTVNSIRALLFDELVVNAK